METEEIKFYTVDENYLKYLHIYDKKVPLQNYNKHKKFFCGIVLTINGINYFAPLSHNTKPANTALIIVHNGQPKSSIRFSFMIPIENRYVTYKNFQDELNEENLKIKYMADGTMTEKQAKIEATKYIALLNIEYEYCKNNVAAIKKKAEQVYKIGCNTNHPLNKHCCEFKKLEEVMKSYSEN